MDYKREEIQEYFNDYLADNKEYLEENNPTTWKDDLHFYAFNEDYYMVYIYDAKQWLGDRVFDVINHITEYEMDCFGKVTTDLSDPCAIVNMYVYIIGEEIVSEYLESLKEVA
jgi:hypothetical protein